MSPLQLLGIAAIAASLLAVIRECFVGPKVDKSFAGDKLDLRS